MVLPARLLWVNVLCAWLLLAGISQAQQAGAVDPSFGASLGLEGHVFSVLMQPDGKILVTGFFRNGIARLNADGSPDTGFDPGVGARSYLEALAVQADGKVVIGGFLAGGGGATYSGVARLNADGSLDDTFNIDVAQGSNSEVHVLAVQVGGKVLIGGKFTSVGGVARNGLARLNADGSVDMGFDPDAGTSSTIYTLAVQADGKVVIGGKFTSVGGVARNGLARLNADGSLDTGFDPDVEPSGTINALAVQTDRKMVIGGNFTDVGGVARTRIARLRADGSLDTGFDPGAGPNGAVAALAVQADGKVVIGGRFGSVGGIVRSGVARLNSDGSLDMGFDPGAGVNTPVFGLSLQADGKVVIGGLFTRVDGVARNSVARLNADGSLDTTLRVDNTPGPNSDVYTLGLQGDGKVVIGGVFTSVSGVARSYIARLNSDGSLDAGFDPGEGADNIVESLAVQADGKVIIGGLFTKVGGVARKGIARLNPDGSLDKDFDPGAGANKSVLVLAVQTDGKVVIGGLFTTVGGVARARIARLNSDGSLDEGFDPGAGADSDVYALAVQADGKVIIGGLFTKVGGVARAHIARLNPDGSLDKDFDPGTGANGEVDALGIQADGKVVVGGYFNRVGGVAHNGCARLNMDGSLDTHFGSVAGPDLIGGGELAVQADGKVVIGGLFITAGGAERSGTARLNADGSLDTGFGPGARANGNVLALAVQMDGKVLICGNFSRVDGAVRNFVARLNSDGSIDPDFISGNGVPLIDALALQPDDNKVVVGGDFSNVSGTPANALARLNPNGSADDSFAPEFLPGDSVQALALQPDDGDILAAALVADGSSAAFQTARFSTDTSAVLLPHAQSKLHNTIHRCKKADGKFDPDFNVVTDGTTLAVTALSARRALIGGSFGSVNGQARANLARLNADGSLDTSFVGATDGTVRALSQTASGGLVVGGDFSAVDGTGRVRVARLNADGSLDTAFNPGAGPNGPVHTVKALANGQVLIGGSFTMVNGVARGGLALLNADGGVNAGFVPPPATKAVRHGARPTPRAASADDTAAAAVMSLDVQADGKVIVGGLFDQLGDATRHNVARLNTDGGVDGSFDPGAGPDAAVNALQLQPDGRTLLGGDFASVGGLERRGAARLFGDPVIVSLSAQTDRVTAVHGQRVKFVVTRAGGALVDALTVSYTTVGSAQAGLDFKPLSGDVTIPAGQASAIIKVKLLGAGPDAPPQSTLKLKLKDGDGYVRDATAFKVEVVLVRPP